MVSPGIERVTSEYLAVVKVTSDRIGGHHQGPHLAVVGMASLFLPPSCVIIDRSNRLANHLPVWAGKRFSFDVTGKQQQNEKGPAGLNRPGPLHRSLSAKLGSSSERLACLSISRRPAFYLCWIRQSASSQRPPPCRMSCLSCSLNGTQQTLSKMKPFNAVLALVAFIGSSVSQI